MDVFGLNGEHIIFLSDGGGVIHPKTISTDNPHGIFSIKATGSHAGDKTFLLDKLNMTHSGDYHAHHIDYGPSTNEMRMQLVHKNYHGTFSHVGGAQDYKVKTGFKYNTPEAIAEAERRNKLLKKNSYN